MVRGRSVSSVLALQWVRAMFIALGHAVDTFHRTTDRTVEYVPRTQISVTAS